MFWYSVIVYQCVIITKAMLNIKLFKKGAAMFNLQSSVLVKSGVKADKLQKALFIVNPDNLLADSVAPICELEASTGVNSLFVLSLAATLTNYGSSMYAKLFNNIFGATYFFPDYKVKYSSKGACATDFVNTLVAGYLSENSDLKAYASVESVIAFLLSDHSNTANAEATVTIMNKLASELGLVAKNSAAEKSEPTPVEVKEESEPTGEIDELDAAVTAEITGEQQTNSDQQGKNNGRKNPTGSIDTVTN